MLVSKGMEITLKGGNDVLSEEQEYWGQRKRSELVMTIGGWVLVVFSWLIVIGFAVFAIICNYDKWWVIVISVVLALAICVGFYAIGRWYFASTASGIRAMTDQHSELSNGIERTVTVYTGTGNIIAQYKGKIDIEMKEDYVKFDWEGKRYIYYNCFVETIADIPN